MLSYLDASRAGVAMVSLALAALGVLLPAEALAERPYMRQRFGLRGAVGVGGEALFEGEVNYRDDLQATGGIVTEVEVPVVRWYSLGIEAGAHAWRTDIGNDWQINRNVLIDVQAVSRFRLAWGERSSHGAFYLAIPVGTTVSFARDEYAMRVADEAGVGTGPIDLGFGGGLNVGARLGIQVFFGKVFGLTAEAGYSYRLLRHRVVPESHQRIRFGQGIAQAGVVFAY